MKLRSKKAREDGGSTARCPLKRSQGARTRPKIKERGVSTHGYASHHRRKNYKVRVMTRVVWGPGEEPTFSAGGQEKGGRPPRRLNQEGDI